MTYVTENTEWPEPQVPKATQVLLDKFFATMDNSAPEAGDILAEEICSPDCKILLSGGTADGTEAIRRSRDKAWAVVKTRQHWLDKVYVSNPQASDLMCFGHIRIGMRNGNDVPVEFACRLKIKDPSSSDPRLEYVTVWADSAPIAKAMQG